MKKILYLVILTGCMYNIIAMEKTGHDVETQASQEGFDVFGLGKLLNTAFNHLENVFSSEQEQPEELSNTNKADVQILLDELKTKSLSQALLDATQQDNSKQFISLLNAIEIRKMEPTAESKTVIKKHLNLLQLESRQVTREILENRLKQELSLHVLRKKFAAVEEQLSDDEDYTSARFATKVLDE